MWLEDHPGPKRPGIGGFAPPSIDAAPSRRSPEPGPSRALIFLASLLDRPEQGRLQ